MKDKRNIFFTSDWHIGHENVLGLDSRPFRDLDHMHQSLINNYNSTVGPNDTCFFLGDIGLCRSETISDVISKLHGNKILVIGNHDSKGRQFFLRAGFSSVQNVAAISIAKHLVTMTHCPLRGVFREDVTGMKGARPGDLWHGESKHHLYSIPDFGQFHLHGHIHSPNSGKSKKILGRQFDVGVPANKYRPVSLSTIESWVAKTIIKEKELENKTLEDIT